MQGVAPKLEFAPKAPEAAKQMPQDLLHAEWLRNQGKLEDALIMCEGYLNDHYDDFVGLVMASHILWDQARFGLAQPLLARAAKLQPDDAVIWNNLGVCYKEGDDFEEAEKCLMKSLARDDSVANTWNNLADLYVAQGQSRRAVEAADRALALDPTHPDANYSKGQALLMQGDYREGWQGYEHNLGRHKGRRERLYGTIPRWTGVEGLSVIAYGEQGIGDEISFASCVPDLIRSSKQVIVECDKRLGNLFRRSFGCTVYGTRFNDGIFWPAKHEIDASVAFGSLPSFYRNTPESFPGTPYLVADPHRRVMWRALLDHLGPKLKVGVTWSGGRKHTGKYRRSIPWQELMPVFRQNATFVSLQYGGCPELEEMRAAGIDIHHWPNAVQSEDYDDTAALVAELDLVVTVQQAAVHLAGALGVETFVLVPKAPMWRYGLSGDSMPWYKSVRLYRQKTEWVHPISDIAHDLRARCSR